MRDMKSTASKHASVAGRATGSIFDRVLCGVDDTPAGVAAARLAARVCSPHGSLVVVSVEDPSLAVHAGWAAPIALAELDRAARSSLAEGCASAAQEHPAEGHLLFGPPLDALKAALRREQATLAVVGRRERIRAVGIALGSVATHLLHEAPCPVLVVPADVDLDRWPRSIVVGVDGSPSSQAALAAAHELRARFDADVRTIVATGVGQIDLERARAVAPDLEEQPLRAVDALVAAAREADLVIVGSRGVRGVRALGSVSERVAHEAEAPVLVVRPQGPVEAPK